MARGSKAGLDGYQGHNSGNYRAELTPDTGLLQQPGPAAPALDAATALSVFANQSHEGARMIREYTTHQGSMPMGAIQAALAANDFNAVAELDKNIRMQVREDFAEDHKNGGKPKRGFNPAFTA